MFSNNHFSGLGVGRDLKHVRFKVISMLKVIPMKI